MACGNTPKSNSNDLLALMRNIGCDPSVVSNLEQQIRLLHEAEWLIVRRKTAGLET